MGGAMAIALDRAGFEIDQLVFRSRAILNVIEKNLSGKARFTPYSEYSGSTSDACIISSGDGEIEEIEGGIARFEQLPRVVLHTSGVLASDVLEKMKDAGCWVGSMHPLVAVSDPVLGADRFEDSYFCLEGDEDAVEAAEAIVRAIGGVSFSIDTRDKALYHASAVMAAGHLVALIDTAIETLSKCGINRKNAQEIIFPLIESTVSNLGIQNPMDALTGPYARGDVGTFERHITAFEDSVEGDVQNIYLDLALHSVEMMLQKDPSSERHRKLAELISVAKQKCGC